MNIQPLNLAPFAIVLSSAVWGLFWVPIRYFSDQGINGEWAVVLLYLPAMLALLPALWLDRTRQRRVLKPALLIGLFVGLGLASYGVAILHTTVVRATLLFYLTPVWSTLIGMYWLGEAFAWQRWVAIALGLVGLGFLVTSSGGGGLNVGDALALLSGVAWAIGATFIKHNSTMPIAGLAFFQFLFSVLFVLGFGAALSPLDLPDLTAARQIFLVTAAVSIFMVLPAMFLLFWASQLLSPGRVGLLMMSEALVAIVTASLFLPEETLSAVQWLGAILIVGSSVLEIRATSAQGRSKI